MGENEQNEISKIMDVLTELKVGIARIEERLGNKSDDHERRIGKLEKNQNWIAISIIGAVIVALLKLVVK